jgi:hypothetical protein
VKHVVWSIPTYSDVLALLCTVHNCTETFHIHETLITTAFPSASDSYKLKITDLLEKGIRSNNLQEKFLVRLQTANSCVYISNLDRIPWFATFLHSFLPLQLGNQSHFPLCPYRIRTLQIQVCTKVYTLSHSARTVSVMTVFLLYFWKHFFKPQYKQYSIF